MERGGWGGDVWDTSRPHSSSSKGGYVGVVGGGVCVCACWAQPGPHEPGMKLPPCSFTFLDPCKDEEMRT